MTKSVKFVTTFMFVFVFALLFCGCISSNTKANTEIKNYATSIEAKDLALNLGESKPLDIKVVTTTNNDYDLGFEFLFDSQDVFDVVDGKVVAKNVGSATLIVKAICGFDNVFRENLFVETSLTVTVATNEVDNDLTFFENYIKLGTTKQCVFDDFENLTSDDLKNLEKVDNKFVLYSVLDTKQAKIDAHNKNFFFYAVIMFDNIDFDWYNFTITCNSNALSVQKISNSIFVLNAKNLGNATITIEDLGKNFKKCFDFCVLEVLVDEVEFCKDQSFLLKPNQVVDLKPQNILPSFAKVTTIVETTNDFVVLVSGTKVVAKNEGSCFVSVVVGDFSKTFFICVSNDAFVVSVSQNAFVAKVGEIVEIEFFVLKQFSKNTTIQLNGNFAEAVVDVMSNFVVISTNNKNTFEFEIVLTDLSHNILGKSEKIVVIFS